METIFESKPSALCFTDGETETLDIGLEICPGHPKMFFKTSKKIKIQIVLNSLELPSKFTLAPLGGQCVMNSQVVMRD